jgi:hypothetical protein
VARALIAAVALGVVLACGTGTPASTVGYVTGTVVGWPAQPQGGDTTPAQNAKLSFLDPAKEPVAVAETDAHGAFSASMPGGSYEVRVVAFGQDPIILSANGQSTKTTPVYVEVHVGQVSRLNLVVSTGIL